MEKARESGRALGLREVLRTESEQEENRKGNRVKILYFYFCFSFSESLWLFSSLYNISPTFLLSLIFFSGKIMIVIMIIPYTYHDTIHYLVHNRTIFYRMQFYRIFCK